MKRYACALAAIFALFALSAVPAKATLLYTISFNETPESCIYNCGQEDAQLPNLAPGNYYLFVINQSSAVFWRSGGFVVFQYYTDFKNDVAVNTGSLLSYLDSHYVGENAFNFTVPTTLYSDEILLDGDKRTFNRTYISIFFGIIPAYLPFALGITDNIADINATLVPEPATWALLLFGFGAIGVMLRRSRNLVGT